MNPKVSIYFDGSKHESKWFGFRKYDQIIWKPEQTWYFFLLVFMGHQTQELNDKFITPGMFPNVTTLRFHGRFDALWEERTRTRWPYLPEEFLIVKAVSYRITLG